MTTTISLSVITIQSSLEGTLSTRSITDRNSPVSRQNDAILSVKISNTHEEETRKLL